MELQSLNAVAVFHPNKKKKKLYRHCKTRATSAEIKVLGIVQKLQGGVHETKTKGESRVFVFLSVLLHWQNGTWLLPREMKVISALSLYICFKDQ